MRKLSIFMSLILIIVTLVTVILGGCRAKTTKTSEPIKIGALISMTGFLADLGSRYKDGFNLALKEAGWEVAGRKVELILEDDGTMDVSGSTEKAKKLVDSDHVCLVFTPIFQATLRAVLPYLETMKVPSISEFCSNWNLRKYQYHHSSLGTGIEGCYELGLYAYNTLGFRTLTIMAEDSIAPKNYVASTAWAFTNQGGTVIQKQYFPMGNTDFGPFMANLKKADAFLFFAPGNTPFQLIKQYHQFGIKMPILMAFDCIGEQYLQQMGDDAVGIIGVIHYTQAIDTPANKKFIETYEKTYGRKPDNIDFLGYTLMSLALSALKSTGGDTSPEKIQAALADVKYDSPAGPVSFGPTRWGMMTEYIFKIVKENNQYFYKILETRKNLKPIDEATLPKSLF